MTVKQSQEFNCGCVSFCLTGKDLRVKPFPVFDINDGQSSRVCELGLIMVVVDDEDEDWGRSSSWRGLGVSDPIKNVEVRF